MQVLNLVNGSGLFFALSVSDAHFRQVGVMEETGSSSLLFPLEQSGNLLKPPFRPQQQAIRYIYRIIGVDCPYSLECFFPQRRDPSPENVHDPQSTVSQFQPFVDTSFVRLLLWRRAETLQQLPRCFAVTNEKKTGILHARKLRVDDNGLFEVFNGGDGCRAVLIPVEQPFVEVIGFQSGCFPPVRSGVPVRLRPGTLRAVGDIRPRFRPGRQNMRHPGSAHKFSGE